MLVSTKHACHVLLDGKDKIKSQTIFSTIVYFLKITFLFIESVCFHLFIIFCFTNLRERLFLIIPWNQLSLHTSCNLLKNAIEVHNWAKCCGGLRTLSHSMLHFVAWSSPFQQSFLNSIEVHLGDNRHSSHMWTEAGSSDQTLSTQAVSPSQWANHQKLFRNSRIGCHMATPGQNKLKGRCSHFLNNQVALPEMHLCISFTVHHMEVVFPSSSRPHLFFFHVTKDWTLSLTYAMQIIYHWSSF
jgi:hypothetical protein